MIALSIGVRSVKAFRRQFVVSSQTLAGQLTKMVLTNSQQIDNSYYSTDVVSPLPLVEPNILTSTSQTGGNNGPSEILKLLWRVNSFLMQDFRSADGSSCIPLLVSYRQIGLLSMKVVQILSRYPNVFMVTPTAVILNQQLSTYESRSFAMAEVLADIRKRKETVALRSWRGENFTVWGHYGTEPLFEIERSAVALFGIRAFGVHITGYVRQSDGSVAGVWLQKRADNKPTYPGMMDTMVGGGITAGLTASQVVIKESAEEASVPEHIINRVKPVGTVSFFTESERGLHANTEHVYDLEVPPCFIPRNSDGEVQDFIFVETKDIFSYLLDSNYKLTSTPILTDFLIRHGIINSDSLPDFPEVVEMLHVSLNLHYRMWPKIKSLDYNNLRFSSPTEGMSVSLASMKLSDTDESDSSSVMTEDTTMLCRVDALSRLDSHGEKVYY